MNSKVKQPAIYQSNIAQKGCESEISNVYINDNNRIEYQELGEISKPETNDTPGLCLQSVSLACFFS